MQYGTRTVGAVLGALTLGIAGCSSSAEHAHATTQSPSSLDVMTYETQ